jgi:tetratricopeptide (TPR) repeat protein
MTGELLSFPSRPRRLSHEEGPAAAARALATAMSERVEKAQDLCLDDPELLVFLCGILAGQLETSPATVRDEAEFFHQLVASPKREIGLYDEREYFLGEFALIAGTACRFLFRREEARRWFDSAEASFVLVANGTAHVARLAYQKLALAVEERRFEQVLNLAPVWAENFKQLGMAEDALKCGFLESAALHETGRTPEAITILRDICAKAEELRIPRLAASAATNLAQDYRVLGDLKEALAYARKALSLLEQLNNRVALAKLRWCAGDILREQGKPGESIEAYRAALRDSEEIGIRGDVAALHLVLADVLLGAGQDRQAEWEIRAALPIIDEEKMVPEGYAALSLLRQSLQNHRIDRQALQELHGYWRES